MRRALGQGVFRIAVVLAVAAAACAVRAADAGTLPVIEVPADSGRKLALLVSGDGGWSAGDKSLAEALASAGVAVVGLDVRAYLRGGTRSADGTSRDLAALVERYAEAWHRDRFAFVGYSRGADIGPFVISRWPEELRRRVAIVALVGLGDHASFEFHWQDIIHDTRRRSDLPTRPELDRLKGLRIVCLYGEDERTSMCPALPPAVALVEQHPGGHVLSAASGAATAGQILKAMHHE